jgi:hypothetical protein
MNVAMRQEVERKIASKVITDALAAGYALTIDNGGDNEEFSPTTDKDKILSEMFATDDEKLIFYKDGKCVGFVYFVYGNDGPDVVNDYTMNLEPIMAGANALADTY